VVTGLGSTWWQYLLLFLAVGASWAGVPVIGTAALGAAAVAASQDKLDLAGVLVVAVLALARVPFQVGLSRCVIHQAGPAVPNPRRTPIRDG
jgi:hypothetical protein